MVNRSWFKRHRKFVRERHTQIQPQVRQKSILLAMLDQTPFDRHLMWIEDDFVIRFSPKLKKDSEASTETVRWLTSFEGARLLLPRKFAPDSGFLKRHVERCLVKHSKQN